MKRHGSAVWIGSLQEGKGRISTDSGVLADTQYSFKARFEEGVGTNPEELIAAAHSGCFSMALAGELEKNGLKAEFIKTSAAVSLEKKEGHFSIPKVHLQVTAKILQTDRPAFELAAHSAKENCPVSKLLNAHITMDINLDN